MNFSTFTLAAALGPPLSSSYGNNVTKSTVESSSFQHPVIADDDAIWADLACVNDAMTNAPAPMADPSLHSTIPTHLPHTPAAFYTFDPFFPFTPSPVSTEPNLSPMSMTHPLQDPPSFTPSPVSTHSTPSATCATPPLDDNTSPQRVPSHLQTQATSPDPPLSSLPPPSISPLARAPSNPVMSTDHTSSPDNASSVNARNERNERDDAFDRFYASVWIPRIVRFYLDPTGWKAFVASNPYLGQCTALQCSSDKVKCVLSDEFGCTTCVRLGLVCSHLETCLTLALAQKMNIDAERARQFLRIVNNHRDKLLATRDKNYGGISPLFHYVSVLEKYLKSSDAETKSQPPPYLVLKLRQSIFLAACDRAANAAHSNAQLAMLRDIANILQHVVVDRTISAERAVGQIISLYHERAAAHVVR